MDNIISTEQVMPILDYVEEETQRRLSLSEVEFEPLGLEDLLMLHGKLNEPITFRMRLRSARIDSSEFENLVSGKRVNASGELDSTHCSNILALVDGGWLPSGLTLDEKALLLPDRCTVGAIRGRFASGIRKEGLRDDFLDFAQGKRLRINPILFALEGTSGCSYPTPSELSDLFDRASAKILQALPQATIFPVKAEAIQGALGLVEATSRALSKQQRYLVKAAPLIASPIPRSKIMDVCHNLLDLCDRYVVPKQSLLVFALISAAAARQGRNPALTLLKPCHHYNDKRAFNALADLRAINFLIAASADFPGEKVALLTEDRALAEFWAGLQIHSYQRNGANIHYSMNPHPALLDQLSKEEQSKILRMMSSE